MSADAKLIFSQHQGQPGRAVDAFVFVRDGDYFGAVHNGELVSPHRAAEIMADIIRAYLTRATMAQKLALVESAREQELALRPGGML